MMADERARLEAVAEPGAQRGLQPAAPSATPVLSLAGGLGNHAFVSLLAGPAAHGAPHRGGPAPANVGAALARQALEDPEGVRAPWRSAESETEQALANVVLLRRTTAAAARTSSEETADTGVPAEDSGGSGAGTVHEPTGPSAPAATGGLEFGVIDWIDMLADHPASAGRMLMDILRVWPGVGFFTGAAADVLEGFQDLWAIRDEEAPILKTAMLIRAIVSTINNMIGHVTYVGQVAGDASLVSGFASFLAPIVSLLDATLKTFKVLVDLALSTIDTLIWLAADWQKKNASGESAEVWEDVARGYAVNLLGDGVTFMVDAWDALSGGVGHGEITKTVLYSTKHLISATAELWEIALGWALAFIDVYGSGIIEPDDGVGGDGSAGAAAPGGGELARALAQPGMAGSEPAGSTAAQRALAALALVELQQIKAAYGLGDELLDAAGTTLDEHLAALRAGARELNGGKDPFVEWRDAGVRLVEELTGRAGALEELAAAAAGAEGQAESMREGCGAAVAALDELTLPAVDIPGAEIVLAPLASALEELKSMAREPLLALQASADEVVAFLQHAAELGQTQVARCREQADEIAAGLAKCESVPDVLDLMVSEIAEGIGLGEDFDFSKVHAWWEGIGTQIDGAIEWAQEAASDGPPPAPPALDPSPPPVETQ